MITDKFGKGVTDTLWPISTYKALDLFCGFSYQKTEKLKLDYFDLYTVWAKTIFIFYE